MKRKVSVYLIVGLIGILCTCAYYIQDALLIVFVLGVACLISLAIQGQWKLVFGYLFAFLSALFAEIFMIYLGVWNYTEVHVIGFPVWLPFLWFSAAVFIGSMITLLRSKILRK